MTDRALAWLFSAAALFYAVEAVRRFRRASTVELAVYSNGAGPAAGHTEPDPEHEHGPEVGA